jgi:hypothetical protein
MPSEAVEVVNNCGREHQQLAADDLLRFDHSRPIAAERLPAESHHDFKRVFYLRLLF